jgi:5'-3' exonuclease
MGVPGFVTWIRQYCKDRMILNSLPKGESCEVLYIDGNCLVHPKCFEVLDYCKNVTSIEKLENLMFKRIVKYISFLVDYVQPKECYFAIDGVAPLAKISQQQKRRYRSIEDAIMKDDIKRQFNVKVDSRWSNVVITPGTEFMERLHLYLLRYFQMKKEGSKVKYIYSSYHTSG